MTDNSTQMIIEKIDCLNKGMNGIIERIDSLEDRMNDRFILLEAKFIKRLESEIGNLAEATAKGFAAQEQRFYELENKMNLGFSLVDHKISLLQESYTSKSMYRFA